MTAIPTTKRLFLGKEPYSWYFKIYIYHSGYIKTCDHKSFFLVVYKVQSNVGYFY